jgi:tetratricopeptide (TPR) repeat protein
MTKWSNMLKKCVYAFMLLSVLIIAVQGEEKQREVDKVALKTGEEIECRVFKDDLTGVSYHPASGMDKTVVQKIEDVIEIRFYDTPQTLKNAEQERISGNYPQALGFFDEAIKELKTNKAKYRSFHLQYALYGKAATNAALKKYDEAIASYKQLLAEVPDTRFKRDAYNNWIDCCRNMKSIPALQEFLNELKKEQSDINKNTGFNVQLCIAELELSDGKDKEALSIYKQLELSPDKDVVDKALMGQIFCADATKDAFVLGKLTDRLSMIKDLNPSLITAVYTYKGDIQFKEASEKKDKAQYHDALLLYLKAISLGFPTKEFESYYQRALYNAAICYQSLANLLNKPETTDKYKKQARGLFEELVQRYPNSELTKKAKEVMDKTKDEK